MSRPDLDSDKLLDLGRLAVYKTMWAVLREFYQRSTSSVTSEAKADQDDATKGLDRIARREIVDSLKRTLGPAIDRGYYIVDEEEGPNYQERLSSLEEPDEDRQLIAFVDPVDFTAAANRGLDGSILISFYHRRIGMLAAVVGDIFRKRIYCGSRDIFAYYQEAIFEQDPRIPYSPRHLKTDDVHLDSAVRPLRTSKKQILEDAAINVYMGKPDRLIETVEKGRWLWNHKIIKKDDQGKEKKVSAVQEIYSVGGSLGPIRVADGTWDASVEFVKGFRVWDFSPGAFIAKCARASVINLDSGEEVTFLFNELKQETLREAKITLDVRLGDKALLDADRRKFVVAASLPLARQIRELLLTSPEKTGECTTTASS